VYRADIINSREVEEIIAAVAPDVVIHLAAIHFIPECNANPGLTMRVNVEGTLSVLKACREAKVKHTLVASSGAVYADSAEPLGENAPVAPVDIYGISKKMAEELCHWMAFTKGLPVTVFRLFNTYGPRETNAHIIPEIIAQLKRGNTLRLGNIQPVRDYIYVSDVAAAIVTLAGLTPDPYRIYNLSSGYKASVKELIGIIGSILGGEPVVEIDPLRFREADKQIQTARITSIKNASGWQPGFDLHRGLRALLQYEGLCNG
jgi:UDP-glucose 4-epimerase